MEVKNAIYELEERGGRLLPSQMEFISAPETQKVIASGWGSGKTHIICVNGLILSAIFPGNRGMLARYHSTDLEDSVIPVFMETCPPSWIRNYRKQGPGRAQVILKNGSEVLFRHLHDARAATTSRRVGANLGWAGIDQLEECQIGHWNTLLGRLRLPRVSKKFIFANMNPAGHDEWYKLFFNGIKDLRELPKGKFYITIKNGERFGIAVNAEENRMSNGGFLTDEYFDTNIRGMDAAWVARYVYCSFEDFAGKIYREFSLDSVHNIRPFSVPGHWPCVVGIDVGGDAPWHVGDHRFDEYGNDVKVNEFHKPSVNVAEVAAWIKSNTPWQKNDTLFVIDWENKLAMLELAENGIHCRPAIKKVHHGILRMNGYLHINPKIDLPPWYFETQSTENIARFKDKGSPRSFVTTNCVHTRQERESYIWDLHKINTPRKLDDHSCDSDRYVLQIKPEAAKLPAVDKFKELRKIDPAAAREWEAFDKRAQLRADRQKGTGLLREADCDAMIDKPAEDKQQFTPFGKWEVEG